MAIFRQVHVSFWQDTFVLDLTPEEKYFYLYLMTNSKTTQCGVYELPIKVMELETGYNRETVEKLLNRFIEYGKIEYCQDTKEVLVKNWHKYNISKSPTVKACINKELQGIKTPIFYQYCIDTLSIQYGETRGNNNNNNNNNKNKNNNNNNNPIILTPTQEQFFEVLKSIPNYPFNQEADLNMFNRLTERYPTLDLVEALKDWREYKSDHPLKPKDNPRSQFNTSCKNYVKWGKCQKGGQAHASPGSRDRQTIQDIEVEAANGYFASRLLKNKDPASEVPEVP